jgi:hypothetical protein
MLRDWTDSLRFDGISVEAERLFVRLIMKADDYGRFHADPRLIKASCFPLCDDLRIAAISGWLDELHSRGLILRYKAQGRAYLAVTNYGQRLKCSRAKFPPMEGKAADWLPDHADFPELPGTSGNKLPGTSRNFPELPARREEKRREVEDEVEEEGTERNAPDGASPDPLPVAISWTPESGFSNITDADRAAWAEAYPAVDIRRATAAAGEWLRSNPAKRKKNHRRFLTGWLSREQERGGDIRSNPARGSHAGIRQPEIIDHGF